jgi:CBS domain-containing protein
MASVWPDIRARDVMRTDVVTIPETASLGDAVQALIDNRITGMPVTDEAGQLSGVVSIRDILDHLSESASRLGKRPAFYSSGPGEDEDEDWDLGEIEIPEEEVATVADVMTAEIHAVSTDSGLEEIADKMVEHRIHRVLVTENKKYVGLVSAMDVLSALIR